MLPSQTFWAAILFAFSLLPVCRPAAGNSHEKEKPESSRKAERQLASPAPHVIGLNERWKGGLDGMIARRHIRALYGTDREKPVCRGVS
ncbi:MAG: hypothetical protein H6573_11030 [Lewinellaceae bacterium]|nr:hypothetical protein [Phaeodactylibacter sp.]MCB0613479.1 hypothetical protein [Phaeodactylibacter sp.]MCB9348025.1 hypothetical protein [Lewinellaceae bacterium]